MRSGRSPRSGRTRGAELGGGRVPFSSGERTGAGTGAGAGATGAGLSERFSCKILVVMKFPIAMAHPPHVQIVRGHCSLGPVSRSGRTSWYQWTSQGRIAERGLRCRRGTGWLTGAVPGERWQLVRWQATGHGFEKGYWIQSWRQWERLGLSKGDSSQGSGTPEDIDARLHEKGASAVYEMRLTPEKIKKYSGGRAIQRSTTAGQWHPKGTQHYAPVGDSDTPGGYPSAGGAFMVK